MDRGPEKESDWPLQDRTAGTKTQVPATPGADATGTPPPGPAWAESPEVRKPSRAPPDAHAQSDPVGAPPT